MKELVRRELAHGSDVESILELGRIRIGQPCSALTGALRISANDSSSYAFSTTLLMLMERSACEGSRRTTVGEKVCR